MNPSQLPDDRRYKTIAEMAPGDIGFVVPWAIAADENSRLYIRGNYNFHAAPGGTVRVKIERTAEGVIVYRDTLTDQFRYKPERAMMAAWLPLPVVGLR